MEGTGRFSYGRAIKTISQSLLAGGDHPPHYRQCRSTSTRANHTALKAHQKTKGDPRCENHTALQAHQKTKGDPRCEQNDIEPVSRFRLSEVLPLGKVPLAYLLGRMLFTKQKKNYTNLIRLLLKSKGVLTHICRVNVDNL